MSDIRFSSTTTGFELKYLPPQFFSFTLKTNRSWHHNCLCLQVLVVCLVILDAIFVLAELLIDLAVIKLEHGHIAPEASNFSSQSKRHPMGITEILLHCYVFFRFFTTWAWLFSPSSCWSWLGRCLHTAWNSSCTNSRCLMVLWWQCLSSWTLSSSSMRTLLMG